MALIRRARPEHHTASFSLGDFGTMVSLPFLLLLVILVPERLWQRSCYALSWLMNGYSSNARKRRILRRFKAGRKAVDKDVYRIASMRSEQLLQTLREWSLGWKPRLQLEGIEHLEAARREGKGAVLWIARFSFASLAEKMAFARHGFEVYHVTRPQHGLSNTRFGMKYLNPIRTGPEYRYAAGRIFINPERPADSMNEARKLLKANKFVSIAGGTTEGQLQVLVRFAGKRMRFSAGPPRLAKLAGAPLLPVFVVRDADTRLMRIIVDRPINLDAGGSKEEMIEAAVQEFAMRHKPWLASHPHQWRDWKLLMRKKRKMGQAKINS